MSSLRPRMAVETVKGATAMFATKAEGVLSIREWLGELASPVTDRRAEARLRLAASPRRLVEQAVIEVLPACGPWRREILRLCNSLRMTERLVRRLFLPGRRGRERALLSLLRLEDPRSTAGLVRLWAESGKTDPRVVDLLRKTNISHLLDLLWETARRLPNARMRLGELLSGLGATVGEHLAARVNGGTQEERQWALELVTGCRDPLVIGRLAELCRDKEAATRLVSLLEEIPGEAALLEVMRLVRYAGDWDVRLQAVRTLLRRREPQSLSFLGELMNDRKWMEELCRSLGKEFPICSTGAWRTAYDTLLAACSDMRV